jgi:hypothetical protein
MIGVEVLGPRRIESLAKVDAMSPALRACVHDYGLPIVQACLNAGVTSPSRIRQLVAQILMGAREASQRPHRAGENNRVPFTVDMLLAQSGSGLTAEGLAHLLWQNNVVIIPKEPTRSAVEASMEEASNSNVRVTKETKHRLRLKAAIKASAMDMWPRVVK